MNTSNTIFAFVSLSLSLSLAACKGGGDADKAADKAAAKAAAAMDQAIAKAQAANGTAAPAPAPAAAPAAQGGWVELPGLGLVIEAPAGSTAKDLSEGDMKIVSLTSGSDVLLPTITKATDDMKQTMDAEIETAKMGAKISKQEKLADGYHIESVTDSGLVNIKIYRTIAGADYDCGSVVPEEKYADAVRKSCLSLKTK